MKWLDYGQIFTADYYGLTYAKSPQALIYEDFVRIYFAACKPDGKKLISYVCFADFSSDFQKIIRVKKQILNDGALGCFDEHGVFPFSPTVMKDKIYAYTTGWSRRVSVSVETGIGLAISHDNGETFERYGNGPILSSSLTQPFLVADAYVRKYNGVFHMWYIYGTDWIVFQNDQPPDRIYKIAHAISSDGINWKTEDEKEVIPNQIKFEAQALPSVIKWDGKYHMMFCYRHAYDFRTNSHRAYKLGYAYSSDLEHWERNDDNVFISKEDWAREMICYPNLFEYRSELYLLYNGNQFGIHGFGLARLVS